MGCGLMIKAVFFFGHTAILGHELVFTRANLGLDFWWRVDWIPVIVAPFTWYVITLWYAGYWDRLNSALRRRHRIGFALTSALGIFLV